MASMMKTVRLFSAAYAWISSTNLSFLHVDIYLAFGVCTKPCMGCEHHIALFRREMEILVEEKAADVYSPQFADRLELEKLHVGNGSSSKNFEDCRSGDFAHSDPSENCLDHTIKRNISVDDVSCSLCKEMLYQPAVLNCGHVYCESCLSELSGEHLQCQVCQSFHPGEFPNICLDLDHFLEEEFPREYAVRRDQVQHKKAQCPHVNPSPNAVRKHKPKAQIPSGGLDLWLKEDVSDVHVGVGCDSCGIYPIIGKRYKCKDCKEAIGFDLCEACYNSTSKLPGRETISTTFLNKVWK
ncbi:hypothetical protein OPV22_030346 [Ensete ventricosum]|uniref:ZZ-type domain-containing protein n=1 Tax=Ensete ventricosum TaxID=4639 RepID=A0AAV8Q9J7_ENSVE|nr:hypothetical protein OPV22_030346 [Ensete ventricosum]